MSQTGKLAKLDDIRLQFWVTVAHIYGNVNQSVGTYKSQSIAMELVYYKTNLETK